MKTVKLNNRLWDGVKFINRYNLRREDIWVVDDVLFYPDSIQDDPLIFEAPDPPKPNIKTRLDTVKTLPELIELLKERL